MCIFHIIKFQIINLTVLIRIHFSDNDSSRKEKSEKIPENPHAFRYDRLNLPREKREEIGRKAKRILDLARRNYVIEQMNLKQTELHYYCHSQVSLENVVLIGHN